MDISPQTIRSTGFKTVKKGYDPDEVESFRSQVAAVVETAQNQATAMEARARAAVAKLQEVSQQAANGNKEAAPAPAQSEDVETISRTLLLAQRTADTTVSEARAEAESITGRARDEASRVLDSARSMAAKTVEESRVEARRAVEDELLSAENEVQGLLARRDFLLGDVDHLEQYLQAQRERLRDAAVQLQELVDRVPGGLGEMRRPLLSASAESTPSQASPEQSTVSRQTSTDVAPSAVEQVPQADAEVPEQFADHDPAPSALFTPASDRSGGLSALALSGSPDAQDSVWRMLDEEVASTRAAQTSFALEEDTEEVAAPSAAQRESFGASGDEVQ